MERIDLIKVARRVEIDATDNGWIVKNYDKEVVFLDWEEVKKC